jgi:hypothetical protein
LDWWIRGLMEWWIRPLREDPEADRMNRTTGGPGMAKAGAQPRMDANKREFDHGTPRGTEPTATYAQPESWSPIEAPDGVPQFSASDLPSSLWPEIRVDWRAFAVAGSSFRSPFLDGHFHATAAQPLQFEEPYC